MQDRSSAIGKQLLSMAIEGGDARLTKLAVRLLVDGRVPVSAALREIVPRSNTTILRIQRVAEALAESGDFDSLEWLFQHRSADVRLHVARLISKYGSSDHVEMLARYCALERDAYVAQELSKTQMNLAQRAANAPSLQRSTFLTEQDQLIIALVSGDELNVRDAPGLVEVFQSPTVRLQDLARSALLSLGEPSVLAVTEFLDRGAAERQAEATWKLLFELDPAAALRRLRSQLNRTTRLPAYAVRFLVSVSDAEAAGIAVEALGLEQPHLRYSLRQALEKLGSVAVEPLASAFRQDSRIREHEADLLARIGGKAVIEDLVIALADPDSSSTLHQSCELALLRFGSAAAEALAAAYSHSDAHMRPRLMRALANTRVTAAIRLLQRDAIGPVALRAPAVAALGVDATEESRRIVLAAVHADDASVRAAAADALSEWELDAALSPLRWLSVDTSPEVAASAFRALERFARKDKNGARQVTLTLLQVANDRRTDAPSNFPLLLFDFLGNAGHIETLSKAVTGDWASSEIKPRIVAAIATRRRMAPRRFDSTRLAFGVLRESTAKPAQDVEHTTGVHFSVVAPGIVPVGRASLLDVWAHEQDIDRVLDRARQQLGTDRIYHRSVGPKPVSRGTKFRVVVSMPGLRFEDEEDLYWDGENANASFLVPVPAETNHGLQTGTIRVLVGPLRIARLHFSLLVADSTTDHEDRTLFEERFKSAFASYASEDRELVLGRIQGMLKQVPMLDVFLDVVSLRSGDKWWQRIEHEIASRDVFYLFWSKHAKESPWVEREWRCALARKGLECIDPVPLEPPANAPPPAELASLHFNDWTLLRS